MALLEIKNLTKIYGKGDNQVIALDNVSFEVEQGEFIAIIGPSGSGKSTLLHLIGGVDKPTSGEVYVNGVNVYKQSEENLAIFRRREVGLIYQFYNLIPMLTVEENMTLPVLLDNRKVDYERYHEILNLLMLHGRSQHLPKELSGGQQQRVSIGRALMSRPKIILADEPTGNLDSKNSKEIMELLKQANQKYHQTIIMVTHDKELAKYAKRIITIEDGKIIKNEMVLNENN